jgi:hypothetical protein
LTTPRWPPLSKLVFDAEFVEDFGGDAGGDKLALGGFAGEAGDAHRHSGRPG